MKDKVQVSNSAQIAQNCLLPTATDWWGNLSVFKRELYIGRHYSDDTPTPDKINELYKMYTDFTNEDLEQVSSCR